MRLKTRTDEAIDEARDSTLDREAQDALEEVAERTRGIGERIGERATEIGERASEIGERISERATEIGERAGKLGESAADTGRRARRTGLLGVLLTRMWWATIKIAAAIPTRAQTIRLLRARRRSARNRAAAIRYRGRSARHRASSVRHQAARLTHRGPDLSDRVDDLTGRMSGLGERVSEVGERAATLATQAAETARSSGRHAAETALTGTREAAETALTGGREAAETARSGGRRLAGAITDGLPPVLRRVEWTLAALVGAAIAYLLDPQSGRRRRHVLRDRMLASGRRFERREVRRAQYMAGKFKGAVHEAVSTPAPPADDNTLADRVRSDIFRRAGAPKGVVNVGVSKGVVYLRGEVESEAQAQQLMEETRRVPGVVGVQSLLHTPGTPAPRGGAA